MTSSIFSKVEVQTIGFLVSELNCLKDLSPSSRCAFAESRVGHWMVTPPASPMKHGATLHAQLAGSHARRADTPLARSIPAFGRE